MKIERPAEAGRLVRYKGCLRGNNVRHLSKIIRHGPGKAERSAAPVGSRSASFRAYCIAGRAVCIVGDYSIVAVRIDDPKVREKTVDISGNYAVCHSN